MNNLIANKLFGLSRAKKLVVQVACDCLLILFCFWLSMALRIDGIYTQIGFSSWLTLVCVIPTTILAFAKLGLYRAVVRYMAEQAVSTILVGAAFSSLIMFATSQFFSLGVPRSVPLIYLSILILMIGGTRLAMRTLYLSIKDSERQPVVIYGASEVGRHTVRLLQESRNYQPLMFIDDEVNIEGTSIAGVHIYSFDKAKKIITKKNVKTALIAVEENNPKLRRQAAQRMSNLGLEVRMMPDITNIIEGKVRISDLPRVKLEELLGRDAVKADPTLMERTIKGKSVLVTGAGGSIGSELCRQIIQKAPRRLVILEVTEFALYALIEELNENSYLLQYELELIPVLGSVTDKEVIEQTITEYAIETIYHAAAYKHVPITEANAKSAFKNNVIGTCMIADAAGRFGVKYFTLVSSDKAVRPTNIMGATKRLAELAIIDAAASHIATKYCAVRFGNVLGSSGSVVPKFEKQIMSGGPITLTHKEITRYFMTVTEAAQLVIQASAMAERAEIYLLEMGDPVLILDLARALCTIHGRTLGVDEPKSKDQNTISLNIIGLRPGEKLKEELLVTGRENKTVHPRIKSEPTVTTEIINIASIIENISKLHSNSEIAKALAALPLDYTIDQRHF